MSEPRIVESGPIHLKIESSAAITMLLGDPEFAEKLQALVKEFLIRRMQASVVDPKQEGDTLNG